MSDSPAPSNRALGVVQAVLALAAVLVAIAWFIPLQESDLTVSFTREGSVLESSDGERTELTPGAAVGVGDRVTVPTGGSVNLVAPDGHNVTVSDSALLVIGESRTTLIGNHSTTDIVVEHGSVRVSGTPRSRTSLDIGLPHGVAGVRGTEFDVVVEGENAVISVHEGSVELSADDGSEVDLGPGQGAVVTAQGAEVEDLPGTPDILTPAAGSVVNTEGTILSWTDVADAASYSVEFAADTDFLQPVLRVTAATSELTIPTLPEDQAVFVRVFAVSGDGLRGAPSESLDLEIRLRLALGLLSLSEGDVTQSIAEFQAALPNYPDDTALLRDLAWSLYLAGQYDESRDIYERARDLQPDDVDLLLELGRVYFMLEEFESAEATYQTVLDAVPDDADALWGLGDTYRLMGRTDEATALLRRTLELAPDHPYAGESLELISGG